MGFFVFEAGVCRCMTLLPTDLMCFIDLLFLDIFWDFFDTILLKLCSFVVSWIMDFASPCLLPLLWIHHLIVCLLLLIRVWPICLEYSLASRYCGMTFSMVVYFLNCKKSQRSLISG